MGADVIKVEKPDAGDDARLWGPPFVDGDSVMFHAINRNKRSVTLDIKNPEDIARLKTLVADADILIQNLRPGTLMRDLPGSALSVVGLPISFDRARPHPYRDSPRLGQHNAEVFPA